MNVYCIPGLGVDERVFQNLNFNSPFTIHHVKWIQPNENEDLAEYAERMCSAVDKTTSFIIIGLSFGGMIATEMTYILKPQKTIIISSASNRYQLPWYVRISKLLKLHKLIPTALLKHSSRLTEYIFGLKTANERRLFQSIVSDTDTELVRWSIDTIVNWRRSSTPGGIIHIHGTADRLLPIRYVKPTYKIIGGGHFMIYSHAKEISALLNQIMAV
ncbi:MAG TPA: alpha/beta hydrolase [Chitinophagaceae bacterium]|nr:alpha/beta hydrolase [Chitinophagaceae bacterium]